VCKELSNGAEEVRMGYRQEITTGEVYIFSTLSGSTPEKYTAEIERIDYNSADDGKNMVIHITDPRLIKSTGGIVQGMSGSPVIQNGKLIGAVTHVFISDPTRGYAIFAENMAEHTK
jgi:stage IV sporulation protein B